MTPHEIERTIEFLLQHQASAEARQERIQTQIGELAEQTGRFAREAEIRDQRLASRIAAQWEQIAAHGEQIAAHGEQIATVTEQIRAFKDACRDLLDHARWTDVRIRRLEQPEG
jgi:chromosome segregation ATPase